MIYLDTETCGFHGFVVFLQYAEDEGEVVLYDIWKNPISETLTLLEKISQNTVCGFNLAFDWFHISKCYSTFHLLLNEVGDFIPEDDIDLVAEYEEKARWYDICLKPKAAFDIMLHARKGPFQSLMKRDDIRIKKVPTLLAEALRLELEKRIHFDNIYFAKRNDPNATQWQIKDCKNADGDNDPAFKDIFLKFHPSGALKELARHALKIEDDLILKFTDVSVQKNWKPVELGYAPFAKAIGDKNDWKGAWPQFIKYHIQHWAFNPIAKKYARHDVIYPRLLYHYFGDPEVSDDDSELACAVGAARWRGFAIDKEKLAKRLMMLKNRRGNIPTAPRQAKAYISEMMNEQELISLKDGTGTKILTPIAGREGADGNWDHTAGWLDNDGNPHPAAIRAKEVLQARRDDKDMEICVKLLKAGRFHASLKVIGTLSSRMSGTDKLNAQGIKSKKEVRECFPLADFDRGFVLSGGDFVSFEVVIAEAVYKDPKLRKDLLDGKSIHGLFAAELFDMSYDDIISSKKNATFYLDGKRGIFSQLYGGNEHTISKNLSIDIETATKASEGFMDRYPGIRAARKRIYNRFCSMRQPGGIGTAVEWHDPDEYIESLLGFPRYFTLENRISKSLFELAQKPPKQWKNVRIKVKRRDRLQTASGSIQSALYAAAFAIQAAAMRQAANHEIQSTGAQITKHLQRRIWDIQPIGANPWISQTLNVHDEVHTVTRPKYIEKISKLVSSTVESFKPKIPLIEIDWIETEKSWADK